jgi:hypothetical protein
MVISYSKDAMGDEQFAWNVVGNMPISSLVGFIVRVQVELSGILDSIYAVPEPCDEKALVVVWDRERRKFDYFLHPDIPVDPLVGTLEVAKAIMVDSQVAAYMRAKMAGVCGPDGRVPNKGRIIT